MRLPRRRSTYEQLSDVALLGVSALLFVDHTELSCVGGRTWRRSLMGRLPRSWERLPESRAEDHVSFYDMPCDLPEGLLRSNLCPSLCTGKYLSKTPQALAFSRDRRGRSVPLRSESFLAASHMNRFSLRG